VIVRADFILTGHTHQQFVKQVGQKGIVKLTCFNAMSRPTGGPLHPACCLCNRSQPCDLPQDLDSVTHLLAIGGSREPVVSRPLPLNGE
jgi:hypothetical protein